MLAVLAVSQEIRTTLSTFPAAHDVEPRGALYAHPIHAVNAELLAGGSIDLPARADPPDLLLFPLPGPGDQGDPVSGNDAGGGASSLHSCRTPVLRSSSISDS
jgi:hypothetical protein